MHQFDVKTSKNVELRRKTFKTTLTTKVIKLRWIASIWRQNEQKCELRRKTFKTTLNYKIDQIIMTCIDLMSKRSKQRKTPNAIKLPWICIDLTSKRSKMLSYVANHSKPLKYKSDQIIMNCINLTSKRAKVMSYVKTFKTTQTYETDQIIMNCIDLTSKRTKMLSYVAKQSKPLNYKSDQIIMTCIDLMSKRSKQRKTPNSIKLPWICIDLTSKRSKMLSYVANHSKPLKYKSDQNTMTCTDLMSKHQNNAKLRKWSLDAKKSKNVELRRKTF